MKKSRNTVNLFVDGVISLGFLLAMLPALTGLTIHEWLGVVFAGIVTVHIILHWNWIKSISKLFFSKANTRSRINYAVNALLFVFMALVIISGLCISEAVLPLLGLRFHASAFWLEMHILSITMSVMMVCGHTIMHWRWVWSMIQKHLLTSKKAPVQKERVR